MCGSSAGWMPPPVSATSMRAAPSEPAVAATRTSPPRLVNLSALPSRLPTAWPIRGASWLIRRGWGGGGRRLGLGATARGRRRVLLDRRLDRPPDVVGAKLEQHEARIELRQFKQVLGHPAEAGEGDPRVRGE